MGQSRGRPDRERPVSGLVVQTTDYHTAGEPFRIITGGVAPLEGATILDKRRFALERLDDVRKLLVHEPRGHADMYGCFVTEPNDDGADLGVVFFHNAGYSTACGHGTIALVTWALESGLIAVVEPETSVVVDVPSGRLQTIASVREGRVERVGFTNVPSYVEARALEAGQEFVHPLEPELCDIYGVIFFERIDQGSPLRQRNVTVFADGEVDRSPCGSGTSARLALLDAGGELPRGDELAHESIVGTVFSARVVGDAEVSDRSAVVTQVEGRAHRTGEHEFVLDEHDDLGTGFLLR